MTGSHTQEGRAQMTRRGFIAATAGVGTLHLAGVALAPRASGAPAPALASSSEKPSSPSPTGPADRPTGVVLATLVGPEGPRLAVRTGRGLLDVRRAAARLDLPAPASVEEVLRFGYGMALRKLVAAALEAEPTVAAFVPEDRAVFGPVVPTPEKILCAGANYRRHTQETNPSLPTSPVFFNKFNNALNGHRGTIRLPAHAPAAFHCGVGLVIVIGREAANVGEAQALDHVFGYATGADFAARDLPTRTGQFMLGKTLDGFAPVGPYLVTADLVPDPDALTLECWVNGHPRQSSNTREMIFGCRRLIA